MDDGGWCSRRRDDDFRAFVTARRAALLRTATLLAAGDTHLAPPRTSLRPPPVGQVVERNVVR
jgi:hypothetical protein